MGVLLMEQEVAEQFLYFMSFEASYYLFVATDTAFPKQLDTYPGHDNLPRALAYKLRNESGKPHHDETT